jgi:hypothetical protein
VPRREPLCHCGFARPNESPARVSPAGDARRPVALVAILVAGVVAVVIYAAAVTQEVLRASARSQRRRTGGEATYPALPAMPTSKRPARPPSTRHVAAGSTTADILDLSLRKIAAETSVLELSYRPFAEACLATASDVSSPRPGSAAGGGWLASLKTARLRAGITLRDKGATVDCDTARRSLVARADALKSDLDATGSVARTNGVLSGPWRTLLAKYELEAWDRY